MAEGAESFFIRESWNFAVLLTAETGVHISENCLENEKLVKKSQNCSEAFDNQRAAAMLKHCEHTKIKGNAVCAYMILFCFFFFPHYVCWSHDVIYDVYGCMTIFISWIG